MRKTRTSKFIREYGMTLQRLADKYGFSIIFIRDLHQRGELHAFIAEQERQKAEVIEK